MDEEPDGLGGVRRQWERRVSPVSGPRTKRRPQEDLGDLYDEQQPGGCHLCSHGCSCL
jgi:hypothetical protein